MSVRDGLLALLTIAPAYGLQLHAEFLDRAAHRSQLNVGQVYATLDRLRERSLVESAGSTDDGLPLYRLTPQGRTEASDWLSGREASIDEHWDDILDRILLGSSIPAADTARILAAYSTVTAAETNDSAHVQRRLAAHAADLRSDALRRLVERAADELRQAGVGGLARDFAGVRPRRGRRASATKAARTDEVA